MLKRLRSRLRSRLSTALSWPLTVPIAEYLAADPADPADPVDPADPADPADPDEDVPDWTDIHDEDATAPEDPYWAEGLTLTSVATSFDAPGSTYDVLELLDSGHTLALWSKDPPEGGEVWIPVTDALSWEHSMETLAQGHGVLWVTPAEGGAGFFVYV